MRLHLAEALTRNEALQSRRRDRNAEQARELARDYIATCARAGAEQRAGIDAAYLRQVAEERVRYHTGSDYSEPHEHDLTADGARKVMKAYHCLVNRLQADRVPGSYQQRVPESRRRVLQYLLRIAVKARRVSPPMQTIATHLGISIRTVRNSLNWLRDNGFLNWRRRIRRFPNGFGGSVVRQVSNGYRLLLSCLEKIGAASLNLGATGKKFRVARTGVQNRAVGDEEVPGAP